MLSVLTECIKSTRSHIPRELYLDTHGVVFVLQASMYNITLCYH